MSHFRQIIRNRNFFLLWIGQVISQFGDRLNQMALIAFIFKRAPGSTFELAKLMAITIIPVFLIGPLAGVYVDRWDRRRTMFVCDLIRAVLVFTIPLFLMNTSSLIPLYIVVFLVFCLSRFFVPAKMSIIPDLVNKEDLLMANSLVNTTGMIAAAMGFGIGGIIVEILGAKGGFYLDASTFLISGILIFFVSTKMGIKVKAKEVLKVGKEIVEVIKTSVVEELKDVFGFLSRQENIKTILNILFILWAALGGVYVIIIVFIQRVFTSVVKDLGLLAVFLGCGLFFGSLVYGKFGRRTSYFKVIFISLVFAGISLIAFTVTSYHFMNFALAAALSFVLGLSISPIMIASNTLVHELTDTSMRGKVFTALEIVVHFAFLIFMFITSSLAEYLGQFAILIGVGIFVILVGIVGLLKKNGQISRA
ncbi:MAG: MFS transporter [Candidatus Omnitrophica bacterium]|nr:MFS transporter [Candidatus Omnitrophota bacterium]MDD5352935.1 MFS transporter [Candidatus Omnitrophota bacterium]MDD5550534.1 MFS transporter [Candidatus Omnitrophota bacterium]